MSENWLSPTNKIVWQKAFSQKAKRVTLLNGKKFTIAYRRNDDGEEIAKVKPEKGFTPCGEFLLGKVTDKMWLTETEDRVAPAPKGESPYTTMMRNFVTSEEKGVNVAEHWPDLATKRVDTLRQGFTKARAELGVTRKVDIINQSGHLYLIKEQ